MPSADLFSRPSLMNNLRLSIFPAQPWFAPEGLWQSVVGEKPSIGQDQPKQFIRSQGGEWAGGMLHLNTTPVRTDWVATPTIRTEGEIGPDHQPLAEMLPRFIDLTRPWFSEAEFAIKRIAFGLQGFLAAENRVEAYKILQSLLPHIPIDPQNSSEFLYQITIPRNVMDFA